MKSHTMFSYMFLFGDHFGKVSNQAKLYYIALNFFCDRGFVSNPLGILDSLGYDKSVYYELVKNEEILTLPDRCEVFITSYYIHNDKFNPKEWYKSPFSIYWIGKLYIKKNGVATFNPEGIPQEQKDFLSNVHQPGEQEPVKQVEPQPYTQKKSKGATEEEWAKLMNELDELNKQEQETKKEDK